MRLGAHPELSSAHHTTCATCDHFPYSDPTASGRTARAETKAGPRAHCSVRVSPFFERAQLSRPRLPTGTLGAAPRTLLVDMTLTQRVVASR
jgi:hypothetical protein